MKLFHGWFCFTCSRRSRRGFKEDFEQMRWDGLPLSEERWHCYSGRGRRWRSTHGHGWQMTEDMRRCSSHYGNDYAAAARNVLSPTCALVSEMKLNMIIENEQSRPWKDLPQTQWRGKAKLWRTAWLKTRSTVWLTKVSYRHMLSLANPTHTERPRVIQLQASTSKGSVIDR